MIIHQPSDKKIKLYKWVETLDRKHRDLPRELIRSYHKKKSTDRITKSQRPIQEVRGTATERNTHPACG